MESISLHSVVLNYLGVEMKDNLNTRTTSRRDSHNENKF